MASFPALASGSVTMYGAVREKRYQTDVAEFVDGSEQRWRAIAPLAGFTLQLTNIGGYDLSNVVEFFRSMKGKFDSTWDLTLDGQTYSYMTFEQDEITWTENKPDRFSLTLKCRQVRKN